jgi:type II secretory pathway component PulF
MDQLEKLKGVWQNQSEPSIKYTKNDIFGMIQKKSSSVVKWILIVSIIEFILPNLIILFTDNSASKKMHETYDLNGVMLNYTIIYVLIIIGFIYYFYKNYKNISADNSIKDLLHSIILTRKTVKYYINTNLTLAAVIGLHVFYKVFNSTEFIDKLPQNTNMVTVWATTIAVFAVVLFLFWCFYKIVYGFFLRKLKRNYKELLKNDYC